MAKNLVRYLLEGDGTVPKFIEDGGYFLDPITEEMIGRSVDEITRYLPASVFKLTRAELKTRIQTLGLDKDINGNTLTSIELDTYIQNFLDRINLGDLI